MPLKPCRECKTEVSTEAATCPKCGVGSPTGAVAAMKTRRVSVGGFTAAMRTALAEKIKATYEKKGWRFIRFNEDGMMGGSFVEFELPPGTKESHAAKWGCLSMFALFAIGLAWCGLSPKAPEKNPGAAERPIGEHKINGEGYVGCMDRVVFDKLRGYAGTDEAAFWTALRLHRAAGTCVSFGNGDVVFLVDAAIIDDVVRVRPKGKLGEYWTTRKAIRD